MRIEAAGSCLIHHISCFRVSRIEASLADGPKDGGDKMYWVLPPWVALLKENYPKVETIEGESDGIFIDE